MVSIEVYAYCTVFGKHAGHVTCDVSSGLLMFYVGMLLCEETWCKNKEMSPERNIG